KELISKVAVVAVLLNPLNPNSGPSLRKVEAVARSLGISLRALEARSPTELDTAFSAMTTARADAVLILADAMFLFQRKQIVELAARYRLPTIYQLREFPEIGGLMSYGASLSDAFRRVATFVDKILKGAKPGDLPVEQP